MKIQGKKGVFYFVAFVVLSAVVATDVQSRMEEEEPLLVYLVDSGLINLEMAELLRDNCLPELLQAQKNVQDFELRFAEKSSYSSELVDGKSSRAQMHQAVNVLFPQVYQILVDCVRGKNLLRNVGKEKSLDSWYPRYLEFLFKLPWSSKRRVLAQASGEAPAPSPLNLSPSPAPSIPLPSANIPASPPSVPFFRPDVNSNSQPTAAGEQTAGASNEQPSNQKSSKKTVVIAVVVTASVTFVIVAVLFLFCRRCGIGRGRGKNDERPLLSLSISDYSIASPQKSFDLGTSVDEQKLGNQPFNSKLNHNTVSGNFYVESHSLNNSKIEIPLEPSTGVATNLAGNSLPVPPRMQGGPGLPPLKPPPGRRDPPKPPPGNAAAPPPRPPAPTPPTIPSITSSAGSHPSPPGPPPPPPAPHGAKAGPRPPPPPPIPSGAKAGSHPPPPPPPGPGVPPPRPPPIGLKPPRPVPSGPHHQSISTQESEAGSSKTKLKPFFWDKVLANPDHSMVWHQIKSGSFQFSEEMIETLFGYAPPANNKNEANKDSSSQDAVPQYIQLIDPKKSQNLAILLKALNVTTEEVCDALEEGNELPPELIQNLLKMAPTSDEELKLRLYSGELSQLGPAERFLKVLFAIPFAFKRLESLLFMCTLQEEISTLKESFAVLEAACSELRKSRLFFKLLEAVLKTGNRMNDGTFRGGAQAFKLDTLLKLSDVKGTDGKTTLLHFVVQEIIRSEGIRAARAAQETRSMSSVKSDDSVEDSSQASDEHFRSLGLQMVSGLGNELENVRRAAVLDADSLTGIVAKLGHALEKARNFLNSDMKNVPQERGFHPTLRSFVQNAEVDVMWSREEEKRIMALVKNTADYFHGNSGKDEGLRLFVIVRDFLIILDKVCKQVQAAPLKSSRAPRNEDTPAAPPDPRQTTPPDLRQRLFPAIADRRVDDTSSSDDES
ncbi:formin homology5 [Perilla frutescens var. hirtella]|uniref:Formin-like protein n=1 Tax=Perilla frutescens var. hirtella TaxID=608512 RepID=A0AAD4JJ93_PERFH|nr:formin homology5 [Perilla frutescens var. hirtella]